MWTNCVGGQCAIFAVTRRYMQTLQPWLIVHLSTVLLFTNHGCLTCFHGQTCAHILRCSRYSYCLLLYFISGLFSIWRQQIWLYAERKCNYRHKKATNLNRRCMTKVLCPQFFVVCKIILTLVKFGIQNDAIWEVTVGGHTERARILCGMRNAECWPRVFCGMWDAEKTCVMRYNLRNGKCGKVILQRTNFRQRQLQPFTFPTHQVQYQHRIF